MSEKPNNPNEYRFDLEGPYTKDTFPMGILAEYLKDLAILYGHQDDMYFLRLDEGSAQAVAWAPVEVQPEIDYGLELVRTGEAEPEVMQAFERIDARARSHNAKGHIISPNLGTVVPFPGCEKVIAPQVTYGPFKQYGTLEGTPISIGGKKQVVSIHIEDAKGDQHICQATRQLAKDIAPFLFDEVIRIEGIGKFVRHPDGRWERKEFTAHTFNRVNVTSIDEDIANFRAIEGKWKELEDPIRELDIIRHDDETQ